MIGYTLLVLVFGVAVLSMFAFGSVINKQLRARREARARADAIRARFVESEARRRHELAMQQAAPVEGLTGVIEKLEESVRFARVPHAELAAPASRPSRTPKGTFAPPLAATPAPTSALPPPQHAAWELRRR